VAAFFHQDKDKLIEALRQEAKVSGSHLEFFAAHFRQHGGSRQWREGELAIKISGTDLPLLEQRATKSSA
jgi:hypothetical protein